MKYVLNLKLHFWTITGQRKIKAAAKMRPSCHVTVQKPADSVRLWRQQQQVWRQSVTMEIWDVRHGQRTEISVELIRSCSSNYSFALLFSNHKYYDEINGTYWKIDFFLWLTKNNILIESNALHVWLASPSGL